MSTVVDISVLRVNVGWMETNPPSGSYDRAHAHLSVQSSLPVDDEIMMMHRIWVR